jgi:hypothetical protein
MMAAILALKSASASTISVFDISKKPYDLVNRKGFADDFVDQAVSRFEAGPPQSSKKAGATAVSARSGAYGGPPWRWLTGPLFS